MCVPDREAGQGDHRRLSGSEFVSCCRKELGQGLEHTPLLSAVIPGTVFNSMHHGLQRKGLKDKSEVVPTKPLPGRTLGIGIIKTKSLEAGIKLFKRNFKEVICFCFEKQWPFLTFVIKPRFK